ncbi:MAG: CheR family methyltransferase, partial [Desulfuromonadaceae bacterium]
FEALQHVVIPELIKHNRSRRVLRIWSAGCSTGEEPYSLAMLLLEKFPELVDWEVHILATDINYQALRQAREGVYGERSLRSTEADYRERYFIPVGDRFVMAPEVRNLVQFSHLNLQTGLYPSGYNGTSDVDLLFCRNVMIYFRQETNRKIIERFSRCLRPDGFLFLGQAETLQNLSTQFSSVHCQGGFYYRLLSAPLPLPES